MKAMIFAAGLGTRLYPLTQKKPKALVEIKGKTLLEITINKLADAGFNDIIINVHHFASMIIDFINNIQIPGVKLSISDERDLLLDTGGGLVHAAWFFNDNKPFLVHNVDIISDIDLKSLYNYNLETNALATLAIHEKNESRVFLFDSEFHLCGWANLSENKLILENKKLEEIKPMGFCGIHVINPSIFSQIEKKGVFSIRDVYLSLCKNHLINGFKHNGKYWLDVGNEKNLNLASDFIV